MSPHLLPPRPECPASLDIELSLDDLPIDMDRVLDRLAVGQRLILQVPDTRLSWTRRWLASRIAHPTEATGQGASCGIDLTPQSLAGMLVQHDLDDVVVELEADPTVDEPPLRARGLLGAEGGNLMRAEEELGCLLRGEDPLVEGSAVWVEGEPLAVLEVASALVSDEELDRLARELSQAPWPAAVVARAASVAGPARIECHGAIDPVLQSALAGEPTVLGLRVLAQLLPRAPEHLHRSIARRLLSLWVASSRERWLGHRRSLLLGTLAAPIPLLRELEAQATGLLRGGHAVTATCLNDLFSVLELMLPPLTPRWHPESS